MSGRLTSPKGDADLQGYNQIVTDDEKNDNHGIWKINFCHALSGTALGEGL